MFDFKAPANPSKAIDFMKYRSMALLFSLIITLISVIGFFYKGVNKGLDFDGGILIECTLEADNKDKLIRNLKDKVRDEYGKESVIQLTNKSTDKKSRVIVRVQNKQGKGANFQSDVILLKDIIRSEAIKNETLSDGEAIESVIFEKVDYVGPKAGKEFFISSLKAVLLAMLFIMAYVWIRFEWFFGLGVIIALLHDAIVIMGFYVFSGYEFDLTSIAAVLTIIGYSVNDTVVIYDRIRQKIRKEPNYSMLEIINSSLNETISRTIMTSLTTAVVCVALSIFGGAVLKGLSLALLFGVVFGTYSSIFISTGFLILFSDSNSRRRT